MTARTLIPVCHALKRPCSNTAYCQQTASASLRAKGQTQNSFHREHLSVFKRRMKLQAYGANSSQESLRVDVTELLLLLPSERTQHDGRKSGTGHDAAPGRAEQTACGAVYQFQVATGTQDAGYTCIQAGEGRPT
ncbi:polypeptide N-acetylgalactosaminyltransferase [Sarotherodon galilaeus]